MREVGCAAKSVRFRHAGSTGILEDLKTFQRNNAPEFQVVPPFCRPGLVWGPSSSCLLIPCSRPCFAPHRILSAGLPTSSSLARGSSLVRHEHCTNHVAGLRPLFDLGSELDDFPTTCRTGQCRAFRRPDRAATVMERIHHPLNS